MPSAPTTSEILIGRRLGLTSKAVRRFVELRLGTVDATLATAIVLRTVAAEPGLSQRELSDRVDVEGPTMVRQLERLEAGGLVERTRDAVDRRIVRVALTPAGRALQQRCATVARAADRDLMRLTTAAERATLEELLDRLDARARELFAGEVPA